MLVRARSFLLAAACLTLLASRLAAAPVTLGSLLGEMSDRDAIARWPSPAFVLHQWSSRDPSKRDPGDAETWHSNNDHDQFLRTEMHEGRREWVLMDEKGPGAVVRFWLPLDAGKDKQTIRFYFDGSPTPGITANFNDLLSGKGFVTPPFAFISWNSTDIRRQRAEPPSEHRGIGGDLYLPIPYAKSCIVTLDSMPFYWIIDTRAYEAGTRVDTFTQASFRAATAQVVKAGEQLFQSPAEPSALDAEVTVPENGELPLELPHGSAALRSLRVSVRPDEAADVLRAVVVRASFDGEETLWCPLAELFGCGARLHSVSDRMRAVTEDGRLRAYWTMPYRTTGRILLHNYGTKPLHLRLGASTGPWHWDDRSLHFHATWRSQHGMKTRPRFDWNYLEVAGQARYVGDTLSVYSPVKGWYGEGDERIYLEGETFPAHIGTGTEDYYGYAWGMPGFFSSPFLSTPRRDEEDRGDWRGYTTTSRLRLLDNIPVRKALKVDMEIWNWEDTSVDYAVGTFWYGAPGAHASSGPLPDEAKAVIKAAPVAPGAQRIAGAIEFEALPVASKSAGASTTVQDTGLTDGWWSGGKQVLIPAKQVGEYIEYDLPAPGARPCIVTLYGTKAKDYGILHFEINGKFAGTDVDCFSTNVVATGPITLAATPDHGKLRLRVTVVGANAAASGSRYFFGLDCATVTPAP